MAKESVTDFQGVHDIVVLQKNEVFQVFTDRVEFVDMIVRYLYGECLDWDCIDMPEEKSKEATV